MSDNQDFRVPEPPTGIGSGFLTDYWHLEEPLPRIHGMELVWYYLQRGFQTVIALPMSNVITIMTIAVSLFLLGGFLLMIQNVGRVIMSAGGTFYVTAYLKEGATETEINDFIRELENSPRVRSVEYVSKQKALENFRRDLGDRSSFLAGLDTDNPLPASIDVLLQPDDLGINTVQRMLDVLKAKSIVGELDYGNEWVEKMQGVLRVFRGFGMLTLAIALIIIVSLIANTIKLVLYSRRDEISIMKLVGASDWFIRIPFIVGGLMQGMVGSVLGLLLLRMSYSLVSLQFRNSSMFGIVLPEPSFLGAGAVAAVILVGLLVGALGSFFSLGRFMNV